ncbi:MAG: GIY-YIG nuclease family protein [Candidatus Marinimicrobia bacterium]|nr:GIY-YIG nuclease family protein [Candidatus Neomarinimicrobiota bacterium]
MWYVYVLKSLKDNGLYIGMSQDVSRRLKEHNDGRTRSTKSRKPFEIVYTEECENREAARKRERYFKSGAGRRYLDKILQ